MILFNRVNGTNARLTSSGYRVLTALRDCSIAVSCGLAVSALAGQGEAHGGAGEAIPAEQRCGLLTLSPSWQAVREVAGGRVLCFELPQLSHKSIDVGLVGGAESPPLKFRLRAKNDETSFRAAELTWAPGPAAHVRMALPASAAIMEISALASPSVSSDLVVSLLEINGVMQLIVTVTRH
jgi:hypothetical protein